MDIAATLRRYDGKRVDPFRSVAEAVRGAPEDALGELLDLAASEEMELQIGATWVLKHLAERGTAPRGPHGQRLLRLLGRPLEPDALLHILQTLPHMEVDAAPQGALRGELLALTEHRRAFVRAWAYNGLGILAARDRSLRQEVQALFDRAARSETAAVKARIRHAHAAWDDSAHG